MHLGLKTGSLCPALYTGLKEPCSFAKALDGPHNLFLNTFRVQKEGTQASVPEWGQGLALT